MGWSARFFFAIVLGSCLAAPAAAQDNDYFWASGQLHAAVLSDIVDGSSTDIAFGAAATFGRRWPESQLGVYVQLDNSWWSEPFLASDESDDVFETDIQTSVNLAVGVEYLFWENQVRMSLSAGPTFLLLETVVDSPGTVGMWFDIRPMGIRLPLTDAIWLAVDPLTFTILLPDLSGIPLILIHYRTALSVEFIIE
ncbi:MAG: hypothetical protein AAGF12_04135 [Myxococcota bacterium]